MVKGAGFRTLSVSRSQVRILSPAQLLTLTIGQFLSAKFLALYSSLKAYLAEYRSREQDSQDVLNDISKYFLVMGRDKAEKQKQKAKDMLGISDDRAKEIFEDQADRKQQKKKELEEKGIE